MSKQTKSFRIEEKIWHKVKIHCAEKKLDLSEYLEKIIKKDLKLR